MFRHLNKSDDLPHILDLCAPKYYDKDKKFIAPAHFTAEETAAWWADVVKAYPVEPVTMFKDSKLANGKLAADVDLNNLTTIKEFKGKAPGSGILCYMPHHADQPTPLIRAQKAGDTIGLKVFSYSSSTTPDSFSASYTVDRYDPTTRTWQTNIYKNSVPSVNDGATPKSSSMAALTFSKTLAGGIYRFNVDPILSAGSALSLSSLDCDTRTGAFAGDAIAQGLTITQRIGYADMAPMWYMYIPKGTKTLDVEVDDDENVKNLYLYTGLPSGATPWKLHRTLDFHGRGTKHIPLEPGEDGSLLCLGSSGAKMPHFYSIPNIGAKAPWMLMVPKDIARADGLTGY